MTLNFLTLFFWEIVVMCPQIWKTEIDHRGEEKDLARIYQASMGYLRVGLYLTQTNQIKRQKVFFCYVGLTS